MSAEDKEPDHTPAARNTQRVVAPFTRHFVGAMVLLCGFVRLGVFGWWDLWSLHGLLFVMDTGLFVLAAGLGWWLAHVLLVREGRSVMRSHPSFYTPFGHLTVIVNVVIWCVEPYPYISELERSGLYLVLMLSVLISGTEAASHIPHTLPEGHLLLREEGRNHFG